MRNIKFRAIHKLTLKKWDEENLYFHDGSWYEDFRALEDGRPLNLEQCAVMQYTGLKDKNGTEIYEGDIVEVTHEVGFKTIGQVVWGIDSHRYGSYPAFTIPEFDSDLNSFAEIFDSGDYDIEIIGNNYEHKHLLEAE